MKKAITFLIILIIIATGSVLIYQNLNHTEPEPEELEQKVYHFNGQDYYYPEDWILEEQKYLTPQEILEGMADRYITYGG